MKYLGFSLCKGNKSQVKYSSCFSRITQQLWTGAAFQRWNLALKEEVLVHSFISMTCRHHRNPRGFTEATLCAPHIRLSWDLQRQIQRPSLSYRPLYRPAVLGRPHPRPPPPAQLIPASAIAVGSLCHTSITMTTGLQAAIRLVHHQAFLGEAAN